MIYHKAQESTHPSGSSGGVSQSDVKQRSPEKLPRDVIRRIETSVKSQANEKPGRDKKPDR